MPRMSELCLLSVLMTVVAVGPHTSDGVETFWNEVDAAGLGRGTAAEDALRVLRSVPLAQLSAGQRRHVKRRILAVLGLDHVPKPAVNRSVRGRREAVAAYMMALYRGGASADDDDDGPLARISVSADDWTDSGLLSSDWLQLSSADTVISYANQGPYNN